MLTKRRTRATRGLNHRWPMQNATNFLSQLSSKLICATAGYSTCLYDMIVELQLGHVVYGALDGKLCHLTSDTATQQGNDPHRGRAGLQSWKQLVQQDRE